MDNNNTINLNSEYSAGFQIELLDLDMDKLEDPILVVGSGATGNLVFFLNAQGHRACGIDPSAEDTDVTRASDFLHVDYGKDYWGSILSPLAFIKEMSAAIAAQDGSDLEWVKCYKSILTALKKGGSFIYAPSLPYIEDILPKEQFEITHSTIRENLSRTKITRK